MLRDIHDRAQFRDGAIHWRLAAGPRTIAAQITASALHLLSDDSRKAYADVFEENRPTFSRLAAAKYAGRRNNFDDEVVVERADVEALLGLSTIG